MSAPSEGEIISFKPEFDAKGREQQGARPWLVVSTNAYNQASKLAMVCPITSHQGTASRANSAEVLLPANCGANGVVLTFQLQTIDWQEHKANTLGVVPIATLKTVRQNLRLCLGL